MFRRPLSPVGSPQPYIPPPPRTSSLFPPIDDELPCLRAEGLVEYIREFNRGDIKLPPSPGTSESFRPKCRLRLWSRTHSPLGRSMNEPLPKLTSPAILRFTIEDVLTSYVSLVFTRVEDPLVVESVTAFGPREMVRIGQFFSSGFLIVATMFLSLLIRSCRTCSPIISHFKYYPSILQKWFSLIHKFPFRHLS